MVENTLRMYMVWEGEEPSEGAVLAFAGSHRQARTIGCGHDGIRGDGDYLATHAQWLREPEYGYLRELALESGPHVVCPPICERCELWGMGAQDREGICASCRQVEREEAMFA